MTLLHPWAFYAAVAAIGLPVLVHWLTRPRPVHMPLSTIRFVREAVQARRTIHRLRNWIILGLRALAVFLLGWAISRPLWGTQPLVQPERAGAGVRVVLLDASQSMAAEAQGVQVFQKAKAAAAGYLVDHSGVQMNLIVMGARPRPVFERLSTNGAALREELARADVLPERANVQAAINEAGDLIAKAGLAGEPCEVVILSDFQRSNWSGADFSPLPASARIQLDSLAAPKPPGNLAILRVGSTGRTEEGRETRLEVDIGNFTEATRKVEVEVALDKATYRLEGVCPTGATTTLSADVPVRGQGWQIGAARLLDVRDALAADNQRAFVLNVRSAPTFALITRQPAETRPSSSYYLERALAPSASGGAPGRVMRVSPPQWDREALADAALFVLDHPGTLAPEQIQQLADGVRRGRGLLFVTAEAEDAVNLKKLAEALGSAWQPPVEMSLPQSGQRRKDLFLVEVRKEQPPFQVFSDHLPALVGSLRIGGGLPSRRLDSGLADDVAAILSDRSAFIVVTSCGAGQIGLLNADLAAGNLASSPAFVPLIGELTARVLGTQAAKDVFVAGEPAAFLLPPSVGPALGLKAFAPDGNELPSGSLVEEAGGVVWRSPLDSRPGVYAIRRGEQTAFAAAAALATDEADLRPIEPNLLRERLAGARQVHFRSQASDDDTRDRFWVWLAIACLFCLIAEPVALRSFKT